MLSKLVAIFLKRFYFFNILLGLLLFNSLGCVSLQEPVRFSKKNEIQHLKLGSVKWELFEIKNPPIMGETNAGQKITLGGLSALNFIKKENNDLYFATVTDRGPNAEEFNSLIGVGRNVRPFLLPQFNPSFVELKLNTQDKSLFVQKVQSFYNSNGKAFTGLPPENKISKISLKSTQNRYEIPVDIHGSKLKGDIDGIDTEGFCRLEKDPQNRIFVSEEYGPDLLSFDQNFHLLKRWQPTKGLPQELLKRKLNRGLEGLACSSSHVYMMLQSPLKSGLEQDQDKIRVLKFDPVQEKVVQTYFYPIQTQDADKIGDLVYLTQESFLVIEQNGKLGLETGIRRLYQIELNKNKDLILQKELLLDLNQIGLSEFEKIEGIALVNSKTIALIVDNDFGLQGPLDLSSSQVKMKSDAASYLVLIGLEKPLF